MRIEDTTEIKTHTGHEVREMTERFTEDHVAVLGDALFQLLLQVSAAVLILAQRGDLALQIL